MLGCSCNDEDDDDDDDEDIYYNDDDDVGWHVSQKGRRRLIEIGVFCGLASRSANLHGPGPRMEGIRLDQESEFCGGACKCVMYLCATLRGSFWQRAADGTGRTAGFKRVFVLLYLVVCL